MPLTVCRDLSPADWVVGSDLPWQRLVGFGPAGFEAYARLRHLPDPQHPGQSENDVHGDGRPEQLPTLLRLLAEHTTTPQDCYFCVWEGLDQQGHTYGADTGPRPSPTERPDAVPALAPPSPTLGAEDAPKVVVPHRAYWLLRGALSERGAWDGATGWSAPHRLAGAEAAFLWPADRAWCVAQDVDPHWAGIGASVAVIARLVADPRLDVVAADPVAEQPAYR